MKFDKKRTLCLFLAGTVLFTATAFADYIIGDGYNGAKTALKHTVNELCENIDSFTATTEFEWKYDGQIMESSSNLSKNDMKNIKHYSETKDCTADHDDRIYCDYQDNEKRVFCNSDGEWHQTNIKRDKDLIIMENPFEEDYAKDAEKVIDALVGEMKDFIVIKDSDSGKFYYGSLTGSQMPAFLNAASSFVLKYGILDSYNMERLGIKDAITSDLYVREAEVKAFVNSDGIMENAMCGISFSGKDENGKEHTTEFFVSCELSDINSTIVEEPKVGDNVVIDSYEEKGEDEYGLMEKKQAGTYSGAIFDQDSYKKIGDVTVTVTEIEGKYAKGHITWNSEIDHFDTDFTAQHMKNTESYFADYVSSSGEKLSFCIRGDRYMSQYSPVLMIETAIVECDLDEGCYEQDDRAERVLAIRVSD